MKIVINSHKNSSIALNHLLESIKACKDYKTYSFIIVIGGFFELNDYEILSEDNITYIKCNFNSIDYNGLITLSELYKNDIENHYFYMHDTCKVGPNFFKILSYFNLEKITTIKMNKNFSMNMGIYSQKIINHFYDHLHTFKNCDVSRNLDELKFLGMINEDYIFKNDPSCILFKKYDGHNFTGPVDYYNTGIQRIVEYYPNFDLYKIKANWGQGGIYLKN